MTGSIALVPRRGGTSWQKGVEEESSSGHGDKEAERNSTARDKMSTPKSGPQVLTPSGHTLPACSVTQLIPIIGLMHPLGRGSPNPILPSLTFLAVSHK